MHPFTVFDLLAKKQGVDAERPFLIDGDRSLTYADVARQVEAFAGWLHHQGVRRGDRVGLHLQKCPEEVVILLSIARIGAVWVNLSALWSTHQVRNAVVDSGLRLLVTWPRRAEELLQAGTPQTLEWVVALGGTEAPANSIGWADLPSDLRAPPCPAVETDLAAITYTSGTSGPPKGVMQTHRNFVAATMSTAQYLRATPDDRILLVLSLCFGYGLLQLLVTMLTGGTLVLQRSTLPKDIADGLELNAITGVALVPPLWTPLVAHLAEEPRRFPSLRYATNAGGKCPDATLAHLPQMFPDVHIYLMYGLTEAIRTTYLDPSLFSSKRGALGMAIPNSDVFIVDENGSRCPPGIVGEVIQRGPTVARGYWNKQEATAERFRPCPGLGPWPDDEMFCWSGDLGRMDEDGVLWFVGRRDFMIKASGVRVSPTEVEEFLYRFSGVRHAVAFGVPDEILGACVEAVIVPDESAVIDLQDMLRFCRREKMPGYMFPRRLHLWDGELPRTGNGKINVSAVVQAITSRSTRS